LATPCFLDRSSFSFNKKIQGKMKRVLFYFLFCWLGFFLPVMAAGGVSILPARPTTNPQTSSWFVYQLDPGKKVKDTVAVVNLSDQEQRVRLYPVDAMTTSDGGFALKQKNEGDEGIGKWITLDEDEVVLEPGKRKKVSFTLNVPRKAEPGDYLGGIVAQPVTDSGEGNIKVVTRTGVRVYLTVNGEMVKKGELKDFSLFVKDGKLWYSFHLLNHGTVRLGKIEADFKIKNDILSWQSASWHLQKNLVVLPEGSVLVSESIPLPISWLGFYRLFGEVSWGSGAVPVNSQLFWIDWSKLAIVGIGLFVAFVSLVFLGKRWKQKRIEGKKGRKRNLKFNKGESVNDEEVIELLIRRVVRQELLLFKYELLGVLGEKKKKKGKKDRGVVK
jgi:hypothetical protein